MEANSKVNYRMLYEESLSKVSKAAFEVTQAEQRLLNEKNQMHEVRGPYYKGLEETISRKVIDVKASIDKGIYKNITFDGYSEKNYYRRGEDIKLFISSTMYSYAIFVAHYPEDDIKIKYKFASSNGDKVTTKEFKMFFDHFVTDMLRTYDTYVREGILTL